MQYNVLLLCKSDGQHNHSTHHKPYPTQQAETDTQQDTQEHPPDEEIKEYNNNNI